MHNPHTIFDLQYWATLTLDRLNSNSSLDEVQGDALTAEVAVEMRASREEVRGADAERVPHAHWTRPCTRAILHGHLLTVRLSQFAV